MNRPVVPWRIVVGGFLHFALPAYLLAGLACCAAGMLEGLTSAELVARTVPYSVWFAILYILVAVITSAAVILLDPLLRRRRRRRARRDPDVAQLQSRRSLTFALAQGRAHFDGDTVKVLDAIGIMAWNHEAQGYQAISADLAQVVSTSIIALEGAVPHDRQELADITTIMLSRIADALSAMQDDHRRLDEGDLHTVARYIDSRYPPSDYAGDSPR